MPMNIFPRSISNFFAHIFHNDVGVDLGTMNTLVYVRGRGMALNEPTVITLNPRTQAVLAVGREAKNMIGVRTPGLTPIRPMRSGAMSDPMVTTKLLTVFLRRISGTFSLMRPRVLVAVASGISPLLRNATRDAFLAAGARDVRLVEEPLAAAIGAGLPVGEPQGCMIVDIGGGTTEIAIIALGGIVHCNSVAVAGDAMDQAIVDHMRDVHKLGIGELTAEEIKMEIGSAVPFVQLRQEEKQKNVIGSMLKALGDNLPGTVTVSSEEIRTALQVPIGQIVDGIAKTLAVCRPSLAGNLTVRGMTITGGSSRLPGLDILLRNRFGIPVYCAEEPTSSVIRGLGRIIDIGNVFDTEQAEPVGNNV